VQNEGRPVEVFTPETINHIEQEVLSDRRLKIREIAERLDLFKTTVNRTLLNHLCLKKNSAK
jgi:predicted transcriptional regulator